MDIKQIAEKLIEERRRRFGAMSPMVRSIANVEYTKGITDFLRELQDSARADEPKAPVGSLATQQPNHVTEEQEPEGGSGAV